MKRQKPSEVIRRILKLDFRSRRAMRNFQSAFLSYGGPDEDGTRILYNALLSHDIDLFFFPESAVPGKRLHRTMSDGIENYDRVILMCSSSSLTRNGVLNEIEQVLVKEAAQGGEELLIPVSLDGFVYSEWAPTKPDLARQIRSRVIANFTDVELNNHTELIGSSEFQRLLSALDKNLTS